MVPDSHLEFSLGRMVTELTSESAKKLKPWGVIIRQIKKNGARIKLFTHLTYLTVYQKSKCLSRQNCHGWLSLPNHQSMKSTPCLSAPSSWKHFSGSWSPWLGDFFGCAQNEDKDCAYQFHLISFLHDFHFCYIG